ncbi:O-antigen ligase family protein [Sphingomonas sp. RHCKR7]|uniref:O-antigen ligase family protein n=1 Tax=Sphingomonas folli TaxID=2862497 RepID=UPI001C6757EC|nr:O-antigen ligase family protein [Sphingomonas folli]MBW6526754.1 O-antigen ligase family protein [Sphingomonas folli]
MMIRARRLPTPSLPLLLLIILFATLWLGGGASRADALGQALVRSMAWALLGATILFGPRPRLGEARPVLLLLVAAVLLSLLQLVPLPPPLWQTLPGRGVLTEAAASSGQAQPWRPLAIVPGAAANAVASLVVPIATYVLIVSLRPEERRWLPRLMPALVVAGALVGLLQFSGVHFNNPLINDTVGEVSGPFANRNHFALFVAMGCTMVPTWAFLDGRSPHWRAPVALGLSVLLALIILSSGSRAGLALGAVGLVCGLLIARKDIRRLLARYPRWVFPSLVAAIVGLIAIFVLISVAADRAVAINRALAMDPAQDMRSRGLPIVWDMVATYFPAGSGLGGFDQLFRLHEPFALLKPTYFNHAHNDWLEIVLDAGAAGALLLGAAVAWWGWASVRAWRGQTSGSVMQGRLGSTLIGMILLASLFDYPARTPMVMAILVVAARWMCGEPEAASTSALPRDGRHL